MAGRQVTLHLDPVRNSENVLTMIDALSQDEAENFAGYPEILACIRRTYDYTDRTEPLSLGTLLGLLDKTSAGFALSPAAHAIYDMRPQVRTDVLHFLLHTAWQRSRDDRLAFSWAYRTVCDHLWELGSCGLMGDESRDLVARLLAAANEQFAGAERLSFSPKSIRGVRKWLEALDPPVMVGETFRRREVCSRELLVLAVGQVAHVDNAQLGTDLLLTAARRNAICRICLIEPAILDRRLDQAIPAFPKVIVPGTRTGPYGRFVRLVAEPTVTALADRRRA